MGLCCMICNGRVCVKYSGGRRAGIRLCGRNNANCEYAPSIRLAPAAVLALLQSPAPSVSLRPIPSLTTLPIQSWNNSTTLPNDGPAAHVRTTSTCQTTIPAPHPGGKIPCPHFGQTPYSRTNSTSCPPCVTSSRFFFPFLSIFSPHFGHHTPCPSCSHPAESIFTLHPYNCRSISSISRKVAFPATRLLSLPASSLSPSPKI